ncbi:MAG: hypothetical protein NNA31_07105 [Nitrospira sp.]|nr:hypothetical protein [Nitrospira sp.]
MAPPISILCSSNFQKSIPAQSCGSSTGAANFHLTDSPHKRKVPEARIYAQGVRICTVALLHQELSISAGDLYDDFSIVLQGISLTRDEMEKMTQFGRFLAQCLALSDGRKAAIVKRCCEPTESF